MSRSPIEYKRMRDVYKPSCIRAIFILESPPRSGKYFYDPAGETNEALFGAMMDLLHIKNDLKNKEDGLRRFQKQGFIVVDASYVPVNGLEGNHRDQAIIREFESLVDDLDSLDPGKEVPLVLVKANVCKVLEHRLKTKGFKVINDGQSIPFPGSGRQRDFREKIALVLEESGLRLAS